MTLYLITWLLLCRYTVYVSNNRHELLSYLANFSETPYTVLPSKTPVRVLNGALEPEFKM